MSKNTTVRIKIEYLFRTRKNKNIWISINDNRVEWSPYNTEFWLEEYNHKDNEFIKKLKLLDRELDTINEGTNKGIKYISLGVNGLSEKDMEDK